jgi:hypothetical protein
MAPSSCSHLSNAKSVGKRELRFRVMVLLSTHLSMGIRVAGGSKQFVSFRAVDDVSRYLGSSLQQV